MNKEKAVASFLEHVEQLSRLPLITDSEMYELYGEEVSTVRAGVARHVAASSTHLSSTNALFTISDPSYAGSIFATDSIRPAVQ
jgi:hypothetical protein